MGKSVREIQQSVYDGDANANNISIVKSVATIYAVVNTGESGVGQSLVTVLNPVSIAGNLTIDSGTVSVDSNTAWSDPNTYIGLATVDIGSENQVRVTDGFDVLTLWDEGDAGTNKGILPLVDAGGAGFSEAGASRAGAAGPR